MRSKSFIMLNANEKISPSQAAIQKKKCSFLIDYIGNMINTTTIHLAKMCHKKYIGLSFRTNVEYIKLMSFWLCLQCALIFQRAINWDAQSERVREIRLAAHTFRHPTHWPLLSQSCSNTQHTKWFGDDGNLMMSRYSYINGTQKAWLLLLRLMPLLAILKPHGSVDFGLCYCFRQNQR